MTIEIEMKTKLCVEVKNRTKERKTNIQQLTKISKMYKLLV